MACLMREACCEEAAVAGCHGHLTVSFASGDDTAIVRIVVGSMEYLIRGYLTPLMEGSANAATQSFVAKG
jgi:hypothetical protein